MAGSGRPSRCVAQAERTIARVRITITAGQRSLIREGSGAGHGIDADLGLAHESALKEAETDATKRALMTFGNPFGLALYDKQQRQVSPACSAASAPTRATAPAPAPASADADAPLNAAAITVLQARIRALSPSRREAFRVGPNGSDLQAVKTALSGL